MLWAPEFSLYYTAPPACNPVSEWSGFRGLGIEASDMRRYRRRLSREARHVSNYHQRFDGSQAAPQSLQTHCNLADREHEDGERSIRQPRRGGKAKPIAH